MVESNVFSVIFDDDAVALRQQIRRDASRHKSRMEKAGTTMSSSSQSFEKRDFLKHQGRNLKFPRDEVFSSQKNIPMNKSEVINMCLADQEESRDDRLNPIDSSTPACNSLRMNFTPQTIYPTAEKIDSFRKMRGW